MATSLLLTELTGLSPGGIIVPGYVALLLDRPAALLGFLLVAGASYGIVLALGTWLMWNWYGLGLQHCSFKMRCVRRSFGPAV